MNWSLSAANFCDAAECEAPEDWLGCCEFEDCEIISTQRITPAERVHRKNIGSPFNCAAAFSWAGGRELAGCVCACRWIAAGARGLGPPKGRWERSADRAPIVRGRLCVQRVFRRRALD